jgi:ribosomal protein L11 methyltransferase
MAWLQLILDTTPENADHVSNVLMDLGAAAVTFEDAADQPLFEPDPGETKLWNQTRAIGLFAADCDMSTIQQQLKNKLNNISHLHVDPLEDKDWSRAWMDNFKPIRFGERLWICPSWHTPPAPEATNILLDPGLAFGTGTHPTTALCLRWLDANPPTDLEVIDFGCGSGILAIAAALLGAKHVHAIDHDPQALLATRNNAQRNDVTDKITTYLPKEFAAAQRADVMLANILANPLIELAPLLTQHVNPNGQIVLSGILVAQAESVAHAYRERFALNPIAIDGDWVRIDGVKN